MTTAASTTSAPEPKLRRAGAVLFAFYVWHMATHISQGHPEQFLWVCNVSCLLVVVGLLWKRSEILSVALLWSLVGTLFWTLDMIFSDDIMLTSYFTHFGGVFLAFYGVRTLGMQRNAWWMAVVAFLILQQLTRWFTPADQNINVAFEIWGEWGPYFPKNYVIYIAILLSFAALVWYGVTRLLAKLYPTPLANR